MPYAARRFQSPIHIFLVSDDLLGGSVQELDLDSDDEDETDLPVKLKGSKSKQKDRPLKIIPTGSDASSDEAVFIFMQNGLWRSCCHRS